MNSRHKDESDENNHSGQMDVDMYNDFTQPDSLGCRQGGDNNDNNAIRTVINSIVLLLLIEILTTTTILICFFLL